MKNNLFFKKMVVEFENSNDNLISFIKNNNLIYKEIENFGEFSTDELDTDYSCRVLIKIKDNPKITEEKLLKFLNELIKKRDSFVKRRPQDTSIFSFNIYID